MRKLALLLVVLFLLGLFGSNFNVANAYDSGCYGNNLYSMTTGQFCNAYQDNYYNYSDSYGCTSAGPYNTITGQFCYGSQPNYSNYSGNFFNQQFQIGSRGADVVALQQMLTNTGFYTGRIDGVYGSRTHTAFLNYQNQYPYQSQYSYQNQYSYQYPYQTYSYSLYQNQYQDPYLTYPYQVYPVIGGYTNYTPPIIFSTSPAYNTTFMTPPYVIPALNYGYPY